MSIFESVFEASPDGLLIVGADGAIRFANTTARRLFGYEAGELAGMSVDMLVPREVAGQHRRYRADYAAAPTMRAMGIRDNLQGRRKDGRLIPVDVMLCPLAGADGSGMLCVVRDATLRHAMEAKLHIANTVFETTQEAIVVTDVNCVIVAVNPAFQTVTEYSEGEAVGRHMRLLRSGRHDQAFYREMWASILTTGEWAGAIWNRRKSGEIYQEWLSISTVRDAQGRPRQYIGVSADMTRMNHAETPAERMAHYDALTGLPNRLLFDSRVQKTWERAHRDRQNFAVMFLDLDGFKGVNDYLGHAAGDELLQAVARRLNESLRETDTIARFGGDEFVIVLEDARYQDVEVIAQQLVDRVAAPFSLSSGGPVRVGLSLGWSYYPLHARDVPTLLRQADEALYRAKAAGRGSWKAYSG